MQIKLSAKEGAKFVSREEWMKLLGPKSDSAIKTKEIICKNCIVDCVCHEMCYKFISETISRE